MTDKRTFEKFALIFFNAPSSRSDYIAQAKTTKFLLKFCPHLWIEICVRVIDIWPSVKH